MKFLSAVNAVCFWLLSLQLGVDDSARMTDEANGTAILAEP